MSGAPTGTRGWADTAQRMVLWLLLGGWVGAWFLFGAVVAPTAFRALPSTQLAGAVVGPTLTALHLYGGVAGAALALLARGLGRSPWLTAVPLLLGALCLLSHFGLTAEIAAMREGAFGPHGDVDSAARFSTLR